MSADTAVSQGPGAGTAFSLGWLMAQLFGPLRHRNKTGETDHLPTVAELGRADRMDLAFTELEDLLKSYSGLSGDALKAAWSSDPDKGFTDAVAALHLAILEKLVLERGQLSAYQLGRALSDTCWLPCKDMGAQFFLRQFNRYRLATLESWLAEATTALPELAAGTVSRSLQNWGDWVDTNASTLEKDWDDAKIHRPVIANLRAQASAWHALLSGQVDTSGQTSTDAWIHAGQSILRTVRRLMLTIVVRFWPVVIIVAAATGGLLYLAIAYSGGTAKVWTALVALATTLGISGASLRSAALKTASGLEEDIVKAATLDAHAWAATWLPNIQQSPMLRYRLASRGVAAPRTRQLGSAEEE